MFGLETIRSMNAAAALKARATRRKPLKVADAATGLQNIPNLGDACADVDTKKTRVATLFCDSSGFGSPGERALTLEQFKRRVAELILEHGPVLVAIESVGQFQVYVAVWKAAARRARRAPAGTLLAKE